MDNLENINQLIADAQKAGPFFVNSVNSKGQKATPKNKSASASNCRLINAGQVAELLGVSTSYAYKIVDQLNIELTQAGYLTVRGKVDREYLKRRFFPSEEHLMNLPSEQQKGEDMHAAV